MRERDWGAGPGRQDRFGLLSRQVSKLWVPAAAASGSHRPQPSGCGEGQPGTRELAPSREAGCGQCAIGVTISLSRSLCHRHTHTHTHTHTHASQPAKFMQLERGCSLNCVPTKGMCEYKLPPCECNLIWKQGLCGCRQNGVIRWP